jgi:hypothetical protein
MSARAAIARVVVASKPRRANNARPAFSMRASLSSLLRPRRVS